MSHPVAPYHDTFSELYGRTLDMVKSFGNLMYIINYTYTIKKKMYMIIITTNK